MNKFKKLCRKSSNLLNCISCTGLETSQIASKSSTSRGLTPDILLRVSLATAVFLFLMCFHGFQQLAWLFSLTFSFSAPWPFRSLWRDMPTAPWSSEVTVFGSVQFCLALPFTWMFSLSSLGRWVRIEIGARLRTWFHLEVCLVFFYSIHGKEWERSAKLSWIPNSQKTANAFAKAFTRIQPGGNPFESADRCDPAARSFFVLTMATKKGQLQVKSKGQSHWISGL